MATATLNPMINKISGKIGSVVFYQRKNKQCIRTWVLPHNPDTAAQKRTRGKFATAVRSWQTMSGDERYIFTRKARGKNMSGYNLFISQYLTKTIGKTGADATATYMNMPYQYTESNRIHSVSKPIYNKYSLLTSKRIQNNPG